jgi:hypothetical protein
VTFGEEFVVGKFGELPAYSAVLKYGPFEIPVLADLKSAPAMISVATTGSALFEPGPELPKGCMVVLIQPDVANEIRVTIQKRALVGIAGGMPAPVLEVGGVRIPIIADLPLGGRVSLVYTGGFAAAMSRELPNELRPGSMVALLMPDVAAIVRPEVERATRENHALEDKIRKDFGDNSNGPAVRG